MHPALIGIARVLSHDGDTPTHPAAKAAYPTLRYVGVGIGSGVALSAQTKRLDGLSPAFSLIALLLQIISIPH